MRGRLLSAFVLALASATVWVGAIPFAEHAPVAVAYSVARGDGPSTDARQAAPQTFVAGVRSDGGLADYSVARFDWRNFFTPQATDVPVAPTDQPTDAPKATDAPATPEPMATPRPEPTATQRPEPTATPQPTTRPTEAPTPRPTPRPTTTPEPTPGPTASPSPDPTPKPTEPPATYSGRSHFWFPAVNIDASWDWYGCDYGGAATLPMGVFRWGCGPASNIYLLSHAASTFKKLRQAFHDGTLQVGENVWYGNAQGDVTKWEVKWIRRVTAEYLNATASDWALNDSPTPIMTLQTCDGAQSQLRLIVRLVPAD
ncbi:MAG: sortase [Chloroflexota bacterium]|nr:sortase [Chloroflexota bacterium]